MAFAKPSLACRGARASADPDGAFALVEALMAASLFLLFFAMVGSVLLSPHQQGRRSSVYDALEAEISRDLGWLKGFSKSWRCLNGPYSGCANDVSTDAMAALAYQPTTSGLQPDCSLKSGSSVQLNLADNFLADARTVVTVPARPYAIPTPATTAQSLSLPGYAAGTTLQRTLSASTTGNRLVVTYTASGDVTLTKSASLLIEASAWCPA
jgi:hypothetical protein